MGSVQSSKSGFRVIRIIPNSPAEHAGLELFFDFIIELDGINHQDFDNEKRDLFFKRIRGLYDKPIKLKVFNIRTNSVREVWITPSKLIFNGVLGATVHYDSYDCSSSLESLRVLEIQENSPAKDAGLIEKSDFIIATNDKIIKTLEEFIDCASQHLEKPLEIFVYNSVFQNIRKVKIFPSNKWGGKGILGCNIGTGYLHKIPQCRKIEESKEIVNLYAPFNFPCHVSDSVTSNSYFQENSSLSEINSSFFYAKDYSHTSSSCFSSGCSASSSFLEFSPPTVINAENLKFQENNVNEDKAVVYSNVNHTEKKNLLPQNLKSDEGREVAESDFEHILVNNKLKNIEKNLILKRSNHEVFERRENSDVLNKNFQEDLNKVCDFSNLNSNYNNIVNPHDNKYADAAVQHVYKQENFKFLNVEKATDTDKNFDMLNENIKNKSTSLEKMKQNDCSANDNFLSCSSFFPLSSSFVHSTTSGISSSNDSSVPYFSSDKNLCISNEKNVKNPVINDFNSKNGNVIINQNDSISTNCHNSTLKRQNSYDITNNSFQALQKNVFTNDYLDAATFYYYENLIPYPGVIYPSAVNE